MPGKRKAKYRTLREPNAKDAAPTVSLACEGYATRPKKLPSLRTDLDVLGLQIGEEGPRPVDSSNKLNRQSFPHRQRRNPVYPTRVGRRSDARDPSAKQSECSETGRCWSERFALARS